MLGMDRPGIKPPKKCLKKTSSSKKLANVICKVGNKDELCSKTETTLPLSPLSIDFHVPEMLHENLCVNIDTLEPDSSEQGSKSLDCDPEDVLKVYRFRKPDSLLYEHESNCVYAKQGNKKHPSSLADSLNKQKISLGDYFRTETSTAETELTKEEGKEKFDNDLENDLPEDEVDLEMDISLSLPSETFDQKDCRKQLNKSKGLKRRKVKEEKIWVKPETESHDVEHHIRHEYMTLKRRHKLLEILLEMRFITDRMRQEDLVKEVIAEWRYAATVLDRLCLIIFTLFTLLSLAICLFSAPQLIV